MSYALALVTEEESSNAGPVPAPATADATIIVTAAGDQLTFVSTNPLVTVKGTDLNLKPASSEQQPTTFNLLFVASTGIASFRSPAAEIVLEGNKVGYAVYPNSGGSSFTLAFRNNVPKGDQPASYAFYVFWNGTPSANAGPVFLESEDPTIYLDPPNS